MHDLTKRTLLDSLQLCSVINHNRLNQIFSATRQNWDNFPYFTQYRELTRGKTMNHPPSGGPTVCSDDFPPREKLWPRLSKRNRIYFHSRQLWKSISVLWCQGHAGSTAGKYHEPGAWRWFALKSETCVNAEQRKTQLDAALTKLKQSNN